MVLDDPLPAGLMALNTAFKTEEPVPAGRASRNPTTTSITSPPKAPCGSVPIISRSGTTGCWPSGTRSTPAPTVRVLLPGRVRGQVRGPRHPGGGHVLAGGERLLPPGRADRQGALMLKRLPWGRPAWCLTAALLALAVLAWHFAAASRLDLSALEARPGPLVLDRTGRPLRLVSGAQGRKLVTLPDGAVPALVAAAFVAAEDQRFWRHPGLDPLAILRAAMSNLSHGRIVSGASTITQQLARLTYPGPRSYYRKLVEICRSLRMRWPSARTKSCGATSTGCPWAITSWGSRPGPGPISASPPPGWTSGEAATPGRPGQGPWDPEPLRLPPGAPPGAAALGPQPHGPARAISTPGNSRPGSPNPSGFWAPAPGRRHSPLKPPISSTWSWPGRSRRPRVPSGSGPPWTCRCSGGPRPS